MEASKCPRFYCPDLSNQQIIRLEGQEALHAMKVLRLQKGDAIECIDGKGKLVSAIIQHTHKRYLEASVENEWTEPSHRKYAVHLALAPVKSMDRMSWLLEKLTEIGIDSIHLLKTEHSERKAMNMEKARYTMLAALKQSRQLWLPDILEPIRLQDWLANKMPGQVLIAHCGDEKKLRMQEVYQPSSDVCIMIGPEGDFSPGEVDLAVQNNAIPVTLGIQRLRTETAALSAVMQVHFINDRS